MQDAEPSLEVRLHFGVAHAFYGSCPSNHPVQLWVGSIQTLLHINLFDLRAARRQYSAAASLTDYFASCTPRILPGNDEGGTQVVHSVPAPACQHPDCAGSHSLEIETIDTFWPIILHINPDSGTLARLPIDQSFSIDNGSDGSITYELVGTTSFDFERKHWTSNVLIGDTTFHYDDLHNAGSCVNSFRGVVSAYDEQHAIDASIPRRSPSLIHDTPPATPKNSTTPIPESGINAAGSGAAPFPLGLLSPLGEHQPEVPPPAEWCPCCRSICEHAADKVPTVRCTGCKYWHHIGCVLEADWAIDPVVIWNDELIGKCLMFQTGPDSSFYPARLEGLTSMDQQGEIPGEGEFLRTKQQCAEIAALPADSTYYTWNVGRIEWPQRLTESAQEIYGYENSEISDLLYGARDSIFAIVTGSQSVSHPIWADYEQWMASGKRHNEIGRANEFAENFYSTRILPRDASLIESHVEYIIQCIQPDIPAVPDTPAAVSEALLRRVATLAPILFQLIILRVYLHCTAADDLEIYWLTRDLGKGEKVLADDSLYYAKTGRVIRHPTEPELALQAAQEFTGQTIPPKWCKIGRSVAKAAAAGIPGSFVYASACDGKGDEYHWQSMDSGIAAQVAPKSQLSTPLSEPPIEVLRTDQGAHHRAKSAPRDGPLKDFLAAPLKRKFNSPLGPGVGASETTGDAGPPLRRSKRNNRGVRAIK
ncbi:hypothetical protein GGX14DRAFT_574776 [Mycena pura]|uniref:Zinc finger PHD-type domain-containing protein n=1 Tax=Mycena pura TaxID=153505 RepID=A0AAD6UWQ5_9AGAR|nr:hypothetical protein GGX14DRAFT_574776 [Mycena pura]